MKISIKIGNKKSVLKVKKSSIAELLEKRGINRETVLVIKNKKICTEEEILKDGDEIEILKAVSGG